MGGGLISRFWRKSSAQHTATRPSKISLQFRVRSHPPEEAVI